MSLRWRIALAMAAIAVASTIAIGAVSYRSTRQQLLSEVDRSLSDVERIIADALGLDSPALIADATAEWPELLLILDNAESALAACAAVCRMRNQNSWVSSRSWRWWLSARLDCPAN